MKTTFLIILATAFSYSLFSQNFFVTNYKNTPQAYWGGAAGSSYGGIRTFENYNLLATVLGDNPASLLGTNQTLVNKEPVIIGGVNVPIQPFAFTTRGSRKQDLPMGNRLRQMLTNPLGVEKFDLTLPFTDARVGLSDRSAALRISHSDSDISYHVAIDFDRNDDVSKPFDVIAPADGIVYNSANNGSIAIIHKTLRGKEFLTVYQHLDVESKRHFQDGAVIKRGQKIGVTEDRDSEGNTRYTHLHFGVAIKGPSAVINGVAVPEQWYLIDPFGVYDFRKNRSDVNAYNYLPNNTITNEVKGVNKAFVFMTNPINGSLFFSNEDCIDFNPNLLSISKLSSGEYMLNSNNSAISKFPNFEEASNAMQIIKRYAYTKTCFIGRPNPSFSYHK